MFFKELHAPPLKCSPSQSCAVDRSDNLADAAHHVFVFESPSAGRIPFRLLRPLIDVIERMVLRPHPPTGFVIRSIESLKAVPTLERNLCSNVESVELFCIEPVGIFGMLNHMEELCVSPDCGCTHLRGFRPGAMLLCLRCKPAQNNKAICSLGLQSRPACRQGPHAQRCYGEALLAVQSAWNVMLAICDELVISTVQLSLELLLPRAMDFFCVYFYFSLFFFLILFIVFFFVFSCHLVQQRQRRLLRRAQGECWHKCPGIFLEDQHAMARTEALKGASLGFESWGTSVQLLRP